MYDWTVVFSTVVKEDMKTLGPWETEPTGSFQQLCHQAIPLCEGQNTATSRDTVIPLLSHTIKAMMTSLK